MTTARLVSKLTQSGQWNRIEIKIEIPEIERKMVAIFQ